jgi:phytol kinase
MRQIVEINPWLLMVIVFGLVAGYMILLRIYQVRVHPDPEIVRKLFHLGGGLLGLSFPWLFKSITPVLGLATALAIIFVLLRVIPELHNGPGQVLAGVKRKSVGEFCFLLSICLLFWQAKGNMILYGVPLLILTVADTFAALMGAEYGKQHFRAWKGRKSVEGSATFFLAAFFCVHVPVLLFTEIPRLECLLIAVNLALMVMMAEAAAWWGLDNLIIPAVSFMLLKEFLPMQALQLAEHLAFLLSLSLFILVWRPRTTLADDALFGISLWGYVVWAVAGWQWFVPPLLLFVGYRTVTHLAPRDPARIFNFPVVLANIAGGLLWLLLFRNTGQANYFYPFTAVFATDLAIIALVGHKYVAPESRLATMVLASTGKGMLLLAPCILIADGASLASVINFLTCAASILLASTIFAAIQPALDTYPLNTARWFRQAILTTVFSVVPLLPSLTQS